MQGLRNRERDRKVLKNVNFSLGKFIEEVKECNAEELSWMQLISAQQKRDTQFNITQIELDEQKCLQEFFLSFFQIQFKHLTVLSAERYIHIEKKIVQAKEHPLTVQYKYMHYFFIKKKFKRIQQILDVHEALPENLSNNLWAVWLSLFHRKSIKFTGEDISIYSNICRIYSTLYSNSWTSYSKSIKILNSYKLGDLEPVILADIILYNNDQGEESQAISLLSSALLGAFGILALLRLLKHYFEYNQFQAAQMLCVYVKNKLQGELKEIAEGYEKKIEGLLKKASVPKMSSSNLLMHYFFVRSSVKYGLRVPLNKIKRSIVYIVSSLEQAHYLRNMFDIKVKSI